MDAWLDKIKGHRTFLTAFPVLMGLGVKTLTLGDEQFVSALYAWSLVLLVWPVGYGCSKAADALREHGYFKSQTQ